MELTQEDSASSHHLAHSERGSVLLLVMFISVVLGTVVMFSLSETQRSWTEVAGRFTADAALFEAVGELEIARYQIREAGYDEAGRNEVIQHAVNGTGTIAGTQVTVTAIAGAPGWYTLESRVDHLHGERVIREVVRELDFFSSYNLFVSEDPVGISGSPVGAIHTNRKLELYFPGGIYRFPLSAVEGSEYMGGATEENTHILGGWKPDSDRIEVDFGNHGFSSMDFLRGAVEEDFHIPVDREVEIYLYRVGDEQWVRLREYEKAWIEDVSEERTRQVYVGGHYETQTRDVPVYVDDTRIVQVPVYRTETEVRTVPVYEDQTRTRTVSRKVWVEVSDGSGGGTVGGDGTSGTVGYWTWVDVDEEYTERVQVGTEEREFEVRVVDHYEDVSEPYQRLSHYETIEEEVWVKEYEEETYTREYQRYHGVNRVADRRLPAPANGLILAEGKVRRLEGEIIGRLTIASADHVMIRNNLQYVDAEGDTAYLNGTDPSKPYEPNPDYQNNATLGIISQGDILMQRDVPSNLELNAAMLSIEGRVGIEGLLLDENGEVTEYNKFKDDWGRNRTGSFSKNSIRKLGAVTSARRPADTIVKDGRVRAGFTIGVSHYDTSLLASPPPLFPVRQEPRFFARQIVQ